MEPIADTNIFCLIGKPGSGRKTILREVLKDKDFMIDNQIDILPTGTTRKKNRLDVENSYCYVTEEEYKAIKPDKLIESRSYDSIIDLKTYYYFTDIDYIHFGYNLISIVTPMQYHDIKQWSFIFELKNPLVKINVYSMIINSSIYSRSRRLMNQAATEEEVYIFCNNILGENNEFNYIHALNPELSDASNANTLIIQNQLDNGDLTNYPILLSEEVKSFITHKLCKGI